MTSTDLHRLADQIQREERITHREALGRLGRAGNRKLQRLRQSKKPAPPLGDFWWMRD